MKKLLHVGCGPKTKAQTTRALNTPEWEEIRLDIDKSVSPDVIGTMTDMSEIETGSVDAIYSSHNIEHLYRVISKNKIQLIDSKNSAAHQA